MKSTFADMSTTFLNMVQQTLSKDLVLDANTAGPRSPLFAQELSKILGRNDQIKNDNQLISGLDPAIERSGKIFESLSEKLGDKTGIEFVSALKNIFLTLSKGDLKKASIDADGLGALKKMLIKAGFKETDIDDLIAGFKEDNMDDLMAVFSEKSENTDLPLNDFLDKLFDLPFEETVEIEASPENFIETSALPFLESILNSLGLPREKIQEIFIQADKGEKGLSLDLIIENLQAVQKKSFYTQIHYQSRKGDDNFRPLLKQLGLEQGASGLSQLFPSGDDKLRLLKEQLGPGPAEVKTSPLFQAGDEELRRLREQPGLGQGDAKTSSLFQSGDEELKSFRKQPGLGQGDAKTSMLLQAGDGKLRQLKEQSGLGRSDAKTPRPFQAGDENLRQLQKQLEPGQDDSKSLTLNNLVGSLENLRRKISQKQGMAQVPANNEAPIASEKSQDLLNTLFKGVNLEDKPIETQAFEFSHEQIKNHFRASLLASANGEVNQKNLLSPHKRAQHETDAKLKQNFKEMEFLLSGKKVTLEDMDPSREGKGFLKQMKSRNSKLSDQTQMSDSDLKTNPAQSSQNLLKSKSSFKNLPAYVTHQVSKGLVRAMNQGENTLKIQLKPSELGRLVMTIDNTGNSMKVSIMTDNPGAKEILTSNVSELRTLLSNSGVNLESFDVDMGSNFKQTMADARNPGGKFGKQNQNKKLSFDAMEGEGMEDPLGLLNTLNPDSSLHFVA